MVLLVTPFEGPKTAPRHHRHRRRSIGSPTKTPSLKVHSFLCCVVSPWACCWGHFFLPFFFVREKSRKIESLRSQKERPLRLLLPPKKKESHNTRRRHKTTELFSYINNNNKKKQKVAVSKNTQKHGKNLRRRRRRRRRRRTRVVERSPI